MRILITTPTENFGQQIVRELLAPEFSVRVIVRNPDCLPEEIRDQVEVVAGSSDDPGTLRCALEGVEALFWYVPTKLQGKTNVERHFERFACAAWKAIREMQTPRVVTISTLADRAGSTAGLIAGWHAMEEILNESGAAIRHLHCGWLMENFLSQVRSIRDHGFLSYPVSGDATLPMTRTTDVADTALRWLVRRDWDGVEAVNVYGTQHISFNQAASIMEQVLKRPVRYREASANEYMCELMANGTSPEFARGQVEMFHALVRATYEKPAAVQPNARSLASWIESELLPVIDSLDPWDCLCGSQMFGQASTTGNVRAQTLNQCEC